MACLRGREGTRERRAICFLFFIVALVSCATPGPTPTATVPQPTASPTPLADLVVNAVDPGWSISPYVYGVNHGPWAFVREDQLPLLADARITFVRFPGGNWGDQNNLQPWQVDAFIDLCRRLQAEPQISVRLRGGTVEQALELMRFANVERGYNVRYWSIGNEPSLYPDYDVERFNREWRVFAEAMKAADPTIQLLGPEIHQYTADPAQNPKDRQGRDWMRSFLEANGDLVDIVSFHRYPFPKSMTGEQATPEELLANPAEWERIIPSLRRLIQETTGRDLPIAVTEINSYWSKASQGQTTPDSFLSALWWADTLGRLIEQDVKIVAYFSLQSTPSVGAYGLLGRFDVRPSLGVYRLYRHFGDRLLPVQNDDPSLSLYAARRGDGTLSLLVINRTPEEVTKTLQILGVQPGPSARVWLLDENTMGAEQDSVAWQNPVELTFAPYSATLFLVPEAEP